jgi:hypothetical protein
MHIENNLSENDFIQQIGNNAVRKAQKDSLENGIPNVYSKNGFIYYQLVDGSITMENPFETEEFREQFKILSKK